MRGKGLSLRRSCALIGVERSSLYYKMRPQHDRELCEKLKAIAQRFKRFGYRRAHALIVRSGQIVNHKRI
jgi:putative transposase